MQNDYIYAIQNQSRVLASYFIIPVKENSKKSLQGKQDGLASNIQQGAEYLADKYYSEPEFDVTTPPILNIFDYCNIL